MELNQITEALNGNAELLSGLTNFLLENEKGKEILDNRAEIIYKQRIGEEVNKIHSGYDNDMFELLGEKPTANADGTKQKTYEKTKALFGELAELRKQKDSLTKDEQVKGLLAQIEDLKKNGGGAHWEKTFNTESEKWKSERESLLSRAESAEKNIVDYQKRHDIEQGLIGLQFNDNVPESARKAFVDAIVQRMMASSKIENGKVIYLDSNGAQINDSEYKPQTAAGILKTELKDILKQVNNEGGGGADQVVKGTVQTQNVEGKDVKQIMLVESQIKTKLDFQKHAEKAMLDAGMTRGSKDWNDSLTEAYARYQVSKLPRN